MTATTMSTGAAERVEVERLQAEHDNIAQLLLVLESHLALMHEGEAFDAPVMLDALDYLIDYVQEFHRAREAAVVATIAAREPRTSSRVAALSARHDALHVSGAELYHRLDLVTRSRSGNRTDVVRLGYAYCAELRRLICLEEHALSRASGGDDASARRPRPQTRVEAAYRSRFEELARRVGCDCAYEQR